MSTSGAEQLLSQLRSLVPLGTSPAPSAEQLQQAGDVLRKLKLELVRLPSSPDSPTDLTSVRNVLLLRREALELACFHALYARDVTAFERSVAQLKPLYNDYGAVLPQSANQGPVMGLYLLCLLAHNQIADFHTEYELLCHSAVGGSGAAAGGAGNGPMVPPSPTSSTLVSQSALLSSPHIRFPVQLEAQLMEGSYTSMLAAQRDLPLAVCALFMERLSDTVRTKLADCAQVAYSDLAIADLQKMLLLPDAAAVSKFVAGRPDWQVSGERVAFKSQADDSTKSETPALKLIKQTLDYATELERIV